MWSWDITYLRSPIRGVLFYLYLVVDVWSRKIVGWAVHDVESAHLAATLVAEICMQMEIEPSGIVLHADNGGPMKGATMLATLERRTVDGQTPGVVGVGTVSVGECVRGVAGDEHTEGGSMKNRL